MRHMAVVLASIFVATLAAVGVSAVEPGRAEAASTVKSCTGGDIRLSAAEKQMLELHNKERASRDLPRLCVHPKLQKAANAHSRDMIRRGRFTHGNVGRRLKKFGYRWRAYAENISRDDGRPSPGTTFKGWMRSSSHRSNILDRRLDEVGVGAATGDVNGSRTTAWTVDLATRN
jgi:uncharacterized protein YkwD